MSTVLLKHLHAIFIHILIATIILLQGVVTLCVMASVGMDSTCLRHSSNFHFLSLPNLSFSTILPHCHESTSSDPYIGSQECCFCLRQKERSSGLCIHGPAPAARCSHHLPGWSDKHRCNTQSTGMCMQQMQLLPKAPRRPVRETDKPVPSGKRKPPKYGAYTPRRVDKRIDFNAQTCSNAGY